MMRTILTIQLVICLLTSSCIDHNRQYIYDLKVENLTDPLGIDNSKPRFSWKLTCIRNDIRQSAYQVLVSSDPSMLEKDQADLWDSGKVPSSASVLVPYGEKCLPSGILAYWKVRIWDELDKVSPWSDVAEFSMGLLDERDWKASYIGYSSEEGYKECPQLYTSFEVSDISTRYLLHINSLGYHEVYINGKKAGDAVLTPAVSQFGKRSLVNTYDISSLIEAGRNDLLLWLSSGWYKPGFPGVVHNGPLVKAQLEKISGGVSETVLVTDLNWKGRKSSYTQHGNWKPWNFGGEICNGAWVKTDLNVINLEEREWSPVIIADVPFHIASPQMTEFNRITDTIHPNGIITLNEKQYLVDMGRNLTGWIEIHFPSLEKGQKILMEYCDHLDENGQFTDQKQFDSYIASGEEEEFFINKFNYHGFRYARISNLDKPPDLNGIKAYLIHTDYAQAADFSCSDPDLNSIHDMINYTLRCLSLGGYLIDCPQIERLGYGGDGNASTETAQTMFNLSPLYANWLQAWEDCIREDGGMPHTAPNPYAAGGGPYWCGFIITAGWNTFVSYGDTLILQRYYPVMQKWLGYVDKYTVNGLLTPWPDTDYRGWYLGDWATPRGLDPTPEASVNLVNNCFIAVCYDVMGKVAEVLNRFDDADTYRNKGDALKKNIHDTFFDATTNTYGTGSQLDLSYPLLAGVVPAEQVEPVRRNLLNTILIKHDGHFACGLVGIPVFTEWAVKNNASGLMYSMLKKRTHPGYLYMIDNGGTTTWEYWHGERSYIHNCYNGIGSWFYQSVGGLRTDENYPAYRKVIIQPQVPDGVTWAETWKETPFGRLAVNWKLRNNKMEMELGIPVGIDAEVVIPQGVNKYKIGRKNFSVKGDELTRINVGSGKYRISYRL